MGFKHTMIQRLHHFEVSPSRSSPTNSATTPGDDAEAPAYANVTDFSINRILGQEKRARTPNPHSTKLVVTSPCVAAAADILDLSKTRSNDYATTPYTTTTLAPTIATSVPKTTVLYPTLHAADLLMANATKFYAQFFPHLLPAYAAGCLATPPTLPCQQTMVKRHFAPYVLNTMSSTCLTSPPPAPLLPTVLVRSKSTASSTTPLSSASCTRADCVECLDYYKQYAHKPPSTVNATAGGATHNSRYLVTKSSTEILHNVTSTSAQSIFLTTATNLNLNTSNMSAPATYTPKLNPSITAASTVSEEISYKCRICEKVFGCSETLQAHEKTHKSPRYECTDCGKGFSQLRNYKYHLSVHRGTKEFAAECPECGKTFNDKGYLSSHMKIHRNKKEYECPYCPKSFNQRVAFNMHVRIHTGVKPHKCAECGKRFSRKMLLKQHMRTHSGEKPYQCSVCGKSFADRSNMTLHHRLHSGIKPFSCPICPKAFTKKHHLKTHLNYHTGCKPYVCPHPNCNQAFTQSSNMRTHAKKCQYRPLDVSALPAAATTAASAETAASVTAATISSYLTTTNHLLDTQKPYIQCVPQSAATSKLLNTYNGNAASLRILASQQQTKAQQTRRHPF